MSTGTIYPYPVIDQPFYNSGAVNIEAGEPVISNGTTTLKMTINPGATTRGPLEAEGDTTLYAVKQGDAASTAGDLPVLGVALATIKMGEWGTVRTYGPCLAKVTDTGALVNLVGLGVSATAGQLTDVAVGSGVYVCAINMGDTTGTTAGDKRLVFVLANRDQLAVTACEFGAIT